MTCQLKYKEVDWSEAGLKTEDGEAWGAEYDEPADLTTTHQVVYIHQVDQLGQVADCSEPGLKTRFTD